jgi:hypothetical protein
MEVRLVSAVALIIGLGAAVMSAMAAFLSVAAPRKTARWSVTWLIRLTFARHLSAALETAGVQAGRPGFGTRRPFLTGY